MTTLQNSSHGIDQGNAPEEGVLKSSSGPPNPPLTIKVGLLIAGCVLPLLIFEIAFRTVIGPSLRGARWDDRPRRFYVPESSPDNRDYYYSPEKTQGTYRIIAVGDSFTFAGKGQVYDSYSKRLEHTLNLNNEQRPVEVLNWGIPGYSTWQEVDLVKLALEKYHPDLIILQITLNDPELVPYHVTSAFKRREEMLSVASRSKILRTWQSLGYLVSRYYNRRTHSEYIEYYKMLFSRTDTYPKFAMSIAEIKRLADKSNIPVVAVIFPLFSHPINDSYPFAQEHTQIHATLDKSQFRYLDLTREFTNIPPDRLQAIPGEDYHPNEIGHRIAADAIYQYLRRRRIIPKDIWVKRHGKSRWLQESIPVAHTEVSAVDLAQRIRNAHVKGHHGR